MCYLPDPIERLEMQCEEWEQENVSGDEFRCGCGNTAKLDECETLSPNPYAIPVCGECFKKACEMKGHQTP